MYRPVGMLWVALVFTISTGLEASAKQGNQNPGISIPQQIQNLQNQINTIELTPGPEGPLGSEGPKGDLGSTVVCVS